MDAPSTIVEATAPTRVVLADDGALAVAVAIDRRAFCRLERTGEGVRLESRDALVKAEGRDLSSLDPPSGLALAAHVLRAVGVPGGLKVVTQSRVAPGAGLGGPGALGVAVAAAAWRSLGRGLDVEALWRVVAGPEVEAAGLAAGAEDALAAIHGGVLAVHREPSGVRAVKLPADPGRVEESLVLADAGPPPSLAPSRPGPGPAGEPSRSQVAGLAAALAEHRYADVPRLIQADWAARRARSPEVTSTSIDRIVEAARSAGGAAWACGAGGGGTVAAWAAPGRRGDLERALTAAGLRLLPFRLDLRGLEVD